jgi:glycosyltransferase involved in cell wall biosynthesis
MEEKIQIELFLLCYNEEKMILHTLNYYSKFCSKITIIDNESTDNSIIIAKEFDPSIEIVTLKTNGEYREDLMIETRNKCWKGSKADYVIVCDMDEFLYDEFLLEKLRHAKENSINIPVIIGYNMMSVKFPKNYDLPITTQVKYGIRDRMFDKSIIFNPKNIININFGPGSHSCNPDFKTEDIKDELLELKLLHFKYLDKEYLYKRHDNYSSRMSNINREKRYGYEYLLGNEFIDKVFGLSSYLIKILK